MILAIAILAGVATLALLFKPLFGGSEDFFDCLRYTFQPDIFSWFRGEWGEDLWAELKMGAWLGCAFAAGMGVHVGLEKLFG
jgi:hypothetical protein